MSTYLMVKQPCLFISHFHPVLGHLALVAPPPITLPMPAHVAQVASGGGKASGHNRQTKDVSGGFQQLQDFNLCGMSERS